MSLLSALNRALASLLRSPAARRTTTEILESAERAMEGGRSPGGDRARAPHDGAGSHHVLADRPSSPPIPLVYRPVADDKADPGEIVWAWVPFEDDADQGKDRPVLVLAREDAGVGGSDGSGTVLVCLMLTSHDRGNGTHVDPHGHTWVDIGTGRWDRSSRPSEVRADRLLRIPLDSVRRAGSQLTHARFEAVASAVRQVHGWDR